MTLPLGPQPCFLSVLLWEIICCHGETFPDVFKGILWSEQSERTYFCTVSWLRRFHTGDTSSKEPSEAKSDRLLSGRQDPKGKHGSPRGKWAVLQNTFLKGRIRCRSKRRRHPPEPGLEQNQRNQTLHTWHLWILPGIQSRQDSAGPSLSPGL